MRLVDADALKEKAFSDPDTTMSGEALVYVQDIDEAPTIDAVPVVRCRECKHYIEGKQVSACLHGKGMVEVTPDDFCSCGERKDGEA